MVYTDSTATTVIAGLTRQIEVRVREVVVGIRVYTLPEEEAVRVGRVVPGDGGVLGYRLRSDVAIAIAAI